MQQFQRLITHFHHRLAHAGQRRKLRLGFEPVVEADDRHIFRDAPPAFAQGTHRANGGFVVEGQYCTEDHSRIHNLLHGLIATGGVKPTRCNQARIGI